MMLEKVTLSLMLIATANITIQAQDYFVTKKDTTFCSDLKYSTTGQGYLKTLEYTNEGGDQVSMKGRKNLPDIKTFYIDSTFIDKTPLKADKPDSYIRYTPRAVDGKLKVYLEQQGYSSTTQYTPGSAQGDWTQAGGPMGIYRFYLKMPNGTYYKINNKGNMKKYIKPYLLKCAAFKEQYTGDYSTREQPFMEMIRLYNSVCD